MQRFSLDAQIEEVKREMNMRDKVYAHQIAIMKMKAGEAEYRQARLAAVLKTLEWLKRNEARVRAAIGVDDTPEQGRVRERERPQEPDIGVGSVPGGDEPARHSVPDAGRSP